MMMMTTIIISTTKKKMIWQSSSLWRRRRWWSNDVDVVFESFCFSCSSCSWKKNKNWTNIIIIVVVFIILSNMFRSIVRQAGFDPESSCTTCRTYIPRVNTAHTVYAIKTLDIIFFADSITVVARPDLIIKFYFPNSNRLNNQIFIYATVG